MPAQVQVSKYPSGQHALTACIQCVTGILQTRGRGEGVGRGGGSMSYHDSKVRRLENNRGSGELGNDECCREAEVSTPLEVVVALQPLGTEKKSLE